MDNELNKQLKRLLIVLTIVFSLIGIYLLIFHILPYLKVKGLIILGALSPFILAVVIAVLIEPIVNFFEIRLKASRGAAVLFALIIVLSFISIILVFVSSRLIIELVELTKILPNIYSSLTDEVSYWIKEIRSYISANPFPVEVQESIKANMADVFDTLKQILSKSTELLISFVATLPILISVLIVSAIATFFVSKDKELIINFINNSVSPRIVLTLNKIFNTLYFAITGFIRAQFILISLTAVQAIIGLYILGVDYALTIGVFTGIVDLIPILGPGSVFVPWALWNIIMGNYKFAVALLILYAILTIIRQFLEPKIVAQSIGLHPLATLMAIFIGLRLLGLVGVLIGPIILLILKAYKTISR